MACAAGSDGDQDDEEVWAHGNKRVFKSLSDKSSSGKSWSSHARTPGWLFKPW